MAVEYFFDREVVPTPEETASKPTESEMIKVMNARLDEFDELFLSHPELHDLAAEYTGDKNNSKGYDLSNKIYKT